MKLNLYKSVALCSLLALAGCHDFEEMNTNPNAPVYDPSVMDCGPEGIDIDYTISESALESLRHANIHESAGKMRAARPAARAK